MIVTNWFIKLRERRERRKRESWLREHILLLKQSFYDICENIEMLEKQKSGIADDKIILLRKVLDEVRKSIEMSKLEISYLLLEEMSEELKKEKAELKEELEKEKAELKEELERKKAELKELFEGIKVVRKEELGMEDSEMLEGVENEFEEIEKIKKELADTVNHCSSSGCENK